MNIHEHQAKELLAEFGAPISKGVVIYDLKEIDTKIAELKSKNFVLKAQPRWWKRERRRYKACKSIDELKKEAKILFGKNLITPQTGPNGKKINRLYIEEASEILKEYYLSCLVDRQSSKIAFISSKEGGMDIEQVAETSPDKIITTKIDFSSDISDENIKKILSPFDLEKKQMSEGYNLVRSIFKTLISKDASLIEINPLIITKKQNIICLMQKLASMIMHCLEDPKY